MAVSRELSQSEKLARIFAGLLPGVPYADAFADGMQAYYNAYRERIESGEGITKAYRAEACPILTADACWVHAPRFKKALAQALGELFGTEITFISANSPFEDTQLMLFVDAKGSRWVVTVDADLRVAAGFPLPKAKTIPQKSTTQPELSEMDAVCLCGHTLDGVVPPVSKGCGIQ